MKSLVLIFFLIFPLLSIAQYGPGPADKGKMYYDVKDYNKALDQFNEAISDGGEVSAETFLLRGLTYLELGENQLAVDDFNQVLQKEPANMKALLNRGLAKSKLNEIEPAIADIQRVIKSEQEGELAEIAYFQLGRIYYSQMNMDAAIENFSKVMEINPTNYEAYIFNGASRDIKLDFYGSIKDYTKAIELAPENPEAYVNRGMAKINLLTGSGNLSPTEKEVKSACEDLNKAFALGDKSVKETLDIYCK